MNVAVKLPDDFKGILESFAFLHKLKDVFKNEKVHFHFITTSEDIEVLNLLPLKAFYHQINAEASLGLLKMYRSFKLSRLNEQVFDLYFSLTDKKEDVLLGKLIKAKRRVGFSSAGLGFLLTDKIQKLSGRSFAEQSYCLLKPFSEKVNENSVEEVISRDFQLEGDINGKYVVVDCELLEDDNWEDFLALFKKERVVIYGSDGKYSNKYIQLDKTSKIEFSKLVYYSDAFISSNINLLLLAAYVGVPCFSINEEDVGSITNHLKAKFYHVDLKNFSHKTISELDYGKVFDFIWDELPSHIKE